MCVWFEIRGMRSKLSSCRGTKGLISIDSRKQRSGRGRRKDRPRCRGGTWTRVGIWVTWFGLPVFAKVTKKVIYFKSCCTRKTQKKPFCIYFGSTILYFKRIVSISILSFQIFIVWCHLWPLSFCQRRRLPF